VKKKCVHPLWPLRIFPLLEVIDFEHVLVRWTPSRSSTPALPLLLCVQLPGANRPIVFHVPQPFWPKCPRFRLMNHLTTPNWKSNRRQMGTQKHTFDTKVLVPNQANIFFFACYNDMRLYALVQLVLLSVFRCSFRRRDAKKSSLYVGA